MAVLRAGLAKRGSTTEGCQCAHRQFRSRLQWESFFLGGRSVDRSDSGLNGKNSGQSRLRTGRSGTEKSSGEAFSRRAATPITAPAGGGARTAFHRRGMTAKAVSYVASKGTMTQPSAEKQGHLRQGLTDGHAFEIGPGDVTTFIGHQGEGLIRRWLKWIVLDLLPNGRVYASRIAGAGWKRIQNQQMDTVLKQFARLIHQGVQGVPIGFVPWRHDLNHGYHAVATDVPHNDGTLSSPIELGIGLSGEAQLGTSPQRRGRTGNEWIVPFTGRLRRATLEGQYVRSETGGDLLWQCIVGTGQQTAVQGPRDLGDPFVMKGVKDARFHLRPIMHRHGCCSGSDFVSRCLC